MIDPAIETLKLDNAPRMQEATSVTYAAEVLRDPAVPLLVVTDETEGLVGVVRESDVVALVAETDDFNAVTQCMSTPVTTIGPVATIRDAAERMRTAGVKHLPVVNDRDVYHGVVSRSTLAPYCSRRTLDVKWDEDPLDLNPAEGGGVPAHD